MRSPTRSSGFALELAEGLCGHRPGSLAAWQPEEGFGCGRGIPEPAVLVAIDGASIEPAGVGLL